MEQILLIAAVVALVIVIVLLIVLLMQLSAVRKIATQKDDDAERATLSALESRKAELEMTTLLLRESREEQANSLARFEESMNRQLAENREGQANSSVRLEESMNRQLTENREGQASSLVRLEESMNRQLAENRETVEKRLSLLQEGNETKLEQMRLTVDEKLTETVEKRFAESFTLISERLEHVHRGLGEMQKLAGGVDDLRKVLSGVKTRGNLGEHQLGAILEQVLAPDQYTSNAQVKARSQERVEFAVKIPSKDSNNQLVLLPIDSKFPIEEYERLLLAYEGEGDETVAAVSARLTRTIKTFARTIKDKYINPPVTTDFGIMFVPTEGLYAEILRTPGLFEELQRDYRVTVVGPTNLAAFLSSLRMGFRTLAIEKHSSEVWKTLNLVKNDFARYEILLDNVQKRLDQASSEMEKVSSRAKSINRRLDKVQNMPGEEASSRALESGDTENSLLEVTDLDDEAVALLEEGDDSE